MSIYPHRHDAEARIYKKDGQLFVAHKALLDLGYESLEDFSIVYLNGTFYELQGYAAQPDAWWIEKVDTDADTQPEE